MRAHIFKTAEHIVMT